MHDQSSLHHSTARFLDLIDEHPLQALGMVFVLGVLFSVIAMASRPPSLQYGETDSWWPLTLNLIRGQGYSLCLPQYFPYCGPSNQVTAMREPAPVFLFALAARIGHESLWSAEVVEAIIYLAIILAIYYLTREWAGSRSALLAAFLWILYLPALELLTQVSGDLFAALCVTLGIFFTLRARKTTRTRDWLLAGIWLGLAVLSRSATLVIVLLLVAGWTIESWRVHVKAREIIRPVVVLSGVVILFLAPWLIRNQLALGRAVLGSSLTGYNLYRHNHIIDQTNYFRYVGPEEGAQAIKELIASRPALDGDENEAQLDLVYRGEALSIIKSYPVRYVLLSAYRVFPLWFDWKIAEAYGYPTNHYGYAIMGLQALLLILALVGLQKRLSLTWPLWSSVLGISFLYMAVDARLLYVMPVMPLVISLSAAGGIRLLEKVFVKA